MYILTAVLAALALAEGVYILLLLRKEKKANKSYSSALENLNRRTEKVEREWRNFLTYNGDAQG